MTTAEQDYQERLDEFTNHFLTDYFDGLVGQRDVLDFLWKKVPDEAFDIDLLNDLFENIEVTLDAMIQRQLDN